MSWLDALKLPEPVVKATKHCTGCHATKPVLAFALNADRADGRQSECRMCYRLRYKFIPSLTSWHRSRAQARKANAARPGVRMMTKADKGGVRVKL